MEVDYGIEEFLGDRTEKVSCVMKELYSDFVVQEILADKTVLRIASPSEILAEIREEEDKKADQTVHVPSFVTPEVLEELDGICNRSKPVLIPTEGLSKEARKELHEFVRSRYQEKLGTETKENTIEVSYCGVNSKSRKRKRWNKDTPDNCHFTLAKENKDTSYALGVIAKFLNVQFGSFRTHGIKDRRAVTSQRVSCNRIEKERIMSLNSRLRDILVYDFEYKNEEVKMGGHWGNRFNIILRHLPQDSESLLTERLEHIKKHGFINYFGTQRFGSCDTNTASVGKLILQRKWEDAVRMVLNSANLPGYMGSVGDAIRVWNETGDAKCAQRMLKGSQAYASIEAALFRCLDRGGTWQTCITEALPMNMRSLYVHAYQSLLWNKVVSRRIREIGTEVSADDIGSSGTTLPSGSSIYDVFIPLPGFNPTYTQNYASKWFDEMLTADELTAQSFESLKDRFALNETSRAMMVLPEDVEWSFLRHSDAREFLQNGISTKKTATPDSTEGPLLALRVQLSLSQGVYATVALRQVTGFDMGKKSMKANSSDANLSLANGNGNGDAIEVDAENLDDVVNKEEEDVAV